MRTRDEDEGLRDDGDLEVDDHVELAVVVVDRVAALEGNTELVLEERSLDDDNDENEKEGKWLDKTHEERTRPRT